MKEVEAISGRDVELKMEVCSDPIPSKSTWDWGIAQVEAGQVIIIFYVKILYIYQPSQAREVLFSIIEKL